MYFAPKVRGDLTDQPGLRHGITAVVADDLEALHEASAVSYKSVNDVIRTDGFVGSIPPQYIRK
eukprot:10086695-Alexandrium_andersonii.AAC.1